MGLKLLNYIYTLAFSTSIVLVLVVSFGLHSLQISHTHVRSEQNPNHHSQQKPGIINDLGVYLHAAEKKLFIFIAPALMWTLVTTKILNGDWLSFLFIKNLLFKLILVINRRLESLMQDYIKQFFSSGILNPKLY